MQLTTPSLIWLLAGVFFFILELTLPGFILFFFGVGAWVTALVSWLLPLSPNGQLAVFLLASVISLLCLRGFIKKTFFGGRTADDKSSALAPVGEKAVVVAAIEPPAEGKVQYSGTSWRATATEMIGAGEIVVIVKQDGLIMRVRRIGEEPHRG